MIGDSPAKQGSQFIRTPPLGPASRTRKTTSGPVLPRRGRRLARILTGVFPGGKDGDSLAGRELLDIAEADLTEAGAQLLGRDPDRSLGAAREGEDRPPAGRGHAPQLLEERDHVLED